jgi:signal transduction histidine kinase
MLFPRDPVLRHDRGRGTLFIGMRLLALAAVAGAGVMLLPPGTWPTLALLAAAGAVLGFAQRYAFDREMRSGWVLVLAQVAVWTLLVRLEGSQRSPLFVGYLLEIAFAGLLLGELGCLLAGGAAAVSYAVSAFAFPNREPGTIAIVEASLALGTALVFLVVRRLREHEAELERTRSQLVARADSVATQVRLLGEYLTHALVGIGPTGLVASINPAAALLLGRSRDDHAPLSWIEVLRPDPAGATAIATALAEGQPQRGVPMQVGAASVTAEIWSSPTADGRVTYVLLEAGRPQAEETDPVRRLGESAACVAHQIKNLLQAFTGCMDSLRRASPAAFDSLQPFLRAARSMSTLSDDMLALAGADRPALEVMDLHEVIGSAASLVSHQQTPVRVAPSREPCHVRGNRAQLVHALFNLLENACQASPPGGSVDVGVRADPAAVAVEIVDQGAGPPPELATARGPVRSARGSGFGLMAARRFLESSRGTLTFARAADGRSVCRVTLERAADGCTP